MGKRREDRRKGQEGTNEFVLNMQCKIITLDTIKQETILINNSQTATFFQTYEWLSLWTKHFKSHELIIGVYEGGKIIGIAAFSVGENGISFLGTDPVLDSELVTDYGDIIAEAGKEGDIWNEIITFLKKNYKGYVFNLNLIRDNSVSKTYLEKLGGEVLESDISAYINLPDSWEKYLASLSRHSRHEFRRKMRKLEKELPQAEYVKGKEGDMDEFFRLMALSSNKKKSFLSEKMKGFFRDFFNIFGNNQVELSILRTATRNIAMTLSFFYKDSVLLYNSGFHPQFKHMSPGLLLKAHLISEAIEKKRHVFDFLRGGERYKFDLGGMVRKLYNVKLAL